MLLYLTSILPAAIAVGLSPRISRATLLFVWVLTSITLWCFVPIGSRDYQTYLFEYDKILINPLSESLLKDSLYSIITFCFSRAGLPAEIYFLCLASLALFIKIFAISKFTNKSSLAIFLYMSSFFYLHEFTQVRVALAIGIWINGLFHIATDPKRYYLFTLLATGIHFQAAVGFIVPLFVRICRTRAGRLTLVLCFVAIVLLSYFRIIDSTTDTLIRMVPDARTELIFTLRDLSDFVRPNPFSLISVISFTSSIYLLLRDKKQDPEASRPDKYFAVTVCLLLGSTCLALFPSVPVVAFRTSEFFFALLPIQLIKFCENRKINFQYIIILVFAIFFIYISFFKPPFLLLDPP